jgi:hypothetical protein
MRETSQAEVGAGSGMGESKHSTSDLEKRYPLALALYAVLAALVWFTMDASNVYVLGRPVELRLLPLILIGGFALRTVLVHQAERIRREKKDSY